MKAKSSTDGSPSWHWLRQAWRVLPAGWRQRLTPGVEFVQQHKQHQRLRRGWQRGNAPGSGVSVVGFHHAVIGLGEGARLQAQAWRSADMDVEAVDVSALIGNPQPPLLAMPSGDRTVISHLNPPELLRYLALTDGRAIAGRRHIGYWAWELPKPPPSWRLAFDLVDEIWVPSRFVAESLARLPGAHPPIRVVPHPVHLFSPPAPTVMPAAWLPQQRASLPKAPVVMVAMDLRSSLARKNFDGVVALLRAVQRDRPGAVRWQIKLSGADCEPKRLRQCLVALSGLPDVQILHDDLTDHDMAILVDRSDIIVSLHRAEGFGLLLAHGMHAGKLVIATGWSGNSEFMTADASVRLDWRLIAVRDPSRRYAGSVWAEPDLAQARAAIFRAVDDPDWRRGLALRAPRRLAEALGGRRWLADTQRWLSASTTADAGAVSSSREASPAQAPGPDWADRYRHQAAEPPKP